MTTRPEPGPGPGAAPAPRPGGDPLWGLVLVLAEIAGRVEHRQAAEPGPDAQPIETTPRSNLTPRPAPAATVEDAP